jgi:DNA-binding MarR family transcriptional regulator
VIERADDHSRSAVMHLMEEAVALHMGLRAVTDRLHGRTELTSVCRGVLRDLAQLGPRTVPQLARRRHCSRQHLQGLINRLVVDGMAELVANPDHRRSRLVRLTDRGRETIEAMWRREADLVAALPIASSDHDMETALRVLRELRRLLPDGSSAPKEWSDDGRE